MKKSNSRQKQSTLYLAGFVLCTIALILWVGCGKDGADSASDDASSKYKGELAKIKSLGEPTTFADLNTWHKAVPAANNSALAYLETRKSIPPHGPVDSAYTRAQHGWKRSKNYNPSALRIHPTLMPSARAKLIAHKAHIDQLLNFYSTSPANQPARFPVDWNNGWNTLLAHLAPLKTDANLLAMRSRVFADAGNAGEAILSVLAVHRLAHLLDDEHSEMTNIPLFRCTLKFQFLG